MTFYPPKNNSFPILFVFKDNKNPVKRLLKICVIAKKNTPKLIRRVFSKLRTKKY